MTVMVDVPRNVTNRARVVRRAHRSEFSDVSAYVRWHVVDADGQCIPEVCAQDRGLCGFKRRKQASDATREYNRSLGL